MSQHGDVIWSFLYVILPSWRFDTRLQAIEIHVNVARLRYSDSAVIWEKPYRTKAQWRNVHTPLASTGFCFDWLCSLRTCHALYWRQEKLPCFSARRRYCTKFVPLVLWMCRKTTVSVLSSKLCWGATSPSSTSASSADRVTFNGSWRVTTQDAGNCRYWFVESISVVK